MLSAAAVNKTFLAPHVIKWSGFQVIGESLLSVLQCQTFPYSLGQRDETLERAILETPDLSEHVRPPPQTPPFRWSPVVNGFRRNSIQNRMNSNRLKNEHIQNRIPRDRNG
jgi:hypothetical protein